MVFLEYPRCATCRKAKKWLDARQKVYTDRHIVQENPTVEELKEWQQKSGLPLKKFFNTSGQLYKQMNLKEKLAGMNEDEHLELLASNGMLVKRPLVLYGNIVLTGFKEEEWEEKLK